MNIVTQLVSLVLWAFAFAGLEIAPDQVAQDGYVAVITKNWPLLAIVIVNALGSVYKWWQTWKTNKPNFLMFLTSTNWWTSFGNIVAALLLQFTGIVLPVDAAQKITQFIFSADWIGLSGYILPVIFGLLSNLITKKKREEQKIVLARAGK